MILQKHVAGQHLAVSVKGFDAVSTAIVHENTESVAKIVFGNGNWLELTQYSEFEEYRGLIIVAP
jgi:hypothetical protein